MKKHVSLWLLAIAVAGLLYGCGGGQSSTTTNNTTSNNTSNQTNNQTDNTASQNQAPIANFVSSPIEGKTGVSLDASASVDTDGNISKYEWAFPDGSTAEGQKIERDFGSPGVYEVTLTVTDDKNLTNSMKLNITVVDALAGNRDEHLRLSRGTQLRIPWTQEPRYFLPNATEGTWESGISNLIFEFLLQTNENLENIPGIATWEWNPDNLTYTFYLNPAVEFHDGQPLNCDDVMFSYKAWTHPDYPGVRFGNFEHITGAYDFRYRVIGEVPATDEFIAALEGMTLPDEVRAVYSDYGIEFGEVTLSYPTDAVDEEGMNVSSGLQWDITTGDGTIYSVVRDMGHEGGANLTVRLAEGMTTEWPIEGLTCVDDHTFKVTMDSVQRTFLPYAVASSGIMPEHVYKDYLETNGYDKMQGAELAIGKFVGTGPFKFGYWEPGQYIMLERHDNYWQSRNIAIDAQYPLSGVEQVYYVFVEEQATQHAKLLADEVDVLDTRPAINQYFELKETPGYDTHEYSQLVYDYWHWNFRNPLFQDVNVRKAMCHALDRQEMVDQILLGLGEVANGPSHPLRWDWDDSLREVHPQFDVAKTIELMEAAGWTINKNADGTIASGAVWKKGNQVMEFEIATNAGNNRRNDMMVMMQEMLADAGFRTSTRVLDTNAFYNDYLDGAHTFQTAIAGWRMGTDPDGTSVWHTKSIDTSFNWTGYSNPEIDAIIDEGLKYADLDKALPIYQKMNKMLVEDMGYCWLAFQMGTFANKEGLIGMDDWSPLGPYTNMGEWYWAGKGLPTVTMTPAE